MRKRIKDVYRVPVPEVIDNEFVPFMKRLNAYWIWTTQSCCGHGGRKNAYLCFQSLVDSDVVLEKLVKPMQRRYPNIVCQVSTNLKQPRFTLWLENSKWEKQLDFLVTRLKKGWR